MDTNNKQLSKSTNSEFQPARVLEFKKKCKSREVSSFYQLPPHHQDSILRLIRKYPNHEFYLTGSFAKGKWTNGVEFLKEREVYLMKTNISDLDLVAVPFISRFEEIDFHPWNPTQVLIYKNYELV